MRTLSLVIFCVFLLTAAANAQAGGKSVSGSEVTGSLGMKFAKKYRDSANEVEIAALGGSKLRVRMDLLSHTNSAAASAHEDGRCKMTIEFIQPGVIKVNQAGTYAECGFGHNVTGTGTYKKISKKPEIPEEVGYALPRTGRR